MTDEEAFLKYLAEVKTELGTVLVVELDGDLNIAKTSILTDRQDIGRVTPGLALAKKYFLIVENFIGADLFFFNGKTFLKEWDRKTNSIIEYRFIRSSRKVDPQRLAQDIAQLKRGIIFNQQGPKLPC